MGIVDNSRENFGAEIETEIEEELSTRGYVIENQERAVSVIAHLKLLLGFIIAILVLDIVEWILWASELLSQSLSSFINDIFSVISSLLYIGLIIAFLRTSRRFALWLRELYQSLSEVEKVRFPIGQALWSWFIPIVFWFRPYQIINEIELKRTASEHFNGKEIKINLWWLCFLSFFWLDYVIASLIRVLYNYGLDMPYGWGMYLIPILSVFTTLAGILGLIIAVKITKNFSEYERLLKNRGASTNIIDHLVQD